MAFPGEGILTNLAKSLEDKTIKEFKYFRDFEFHVQDFVIENNILVAKRKKMEKDIEDAKKRNENQIEDDVQNWIEEADIVIQENTKIKQTWSYGWCPYWQYRQGKMLAKRIPFIRDLIQKCNFDRVARSTELPGIRYHASTDFIDFESRKEKLRQLVEALKDGKQYMIGLQGMGGTGKTTLATQVGKQLEESKAFEKVIFVVVSNPLDVNKIRGDIARPLGLYLEEKVQAEHSQHLWTRISENEKKLLIILDDVWEELNLKNIGIPSGPDHKNCYVLITTRDSKVCDAMRCQQIVHLHTLADKDALTLFLSHARSSDDSSSNDLEVLARDFVKECGGLPIAIITLASTLRNRHVAELNAALITLQRSKPFVDIGKDLETVYRCLELSYVNLPNEKVQKLFLLCSIFPEDYEFSINLIVRLGIGSGILEEVDDYWEARSQALFMKSTLINSSLLLNVEEKKSIKMHDVVREVAQWIGKEYIQVIMDLRITLKPNLRFVFWSVNDFPEQFDGAKLEVLILWISGNVPMKDPNPFFSRMPGLKILFLHCEFDEKVPTLSLSKSLLSLEYIHTLILDGWELGDISVLNNLQSLVILEFKNCVIMELPKDIMKLKKLRWLGLRKCKIQKNNPFKVLERCTQLEELYFVGNYNVEDWKLGNDEEIENEIAHDISHSALQMFSIACDGFEYFADDDSGLSRCFKSEHMEHLIPSDMFKYLVRSAEVLELGKIGQMGWKNVAPDIIPLEKGGGDGLIKLYLYEWDDIECLIDNSKYSKVTIFSKLVELHLYCVDVEKLYLGGMPSGFVRQLQILTLNKCPKLQNIFVDENLKLSDLKVLKLTACLMFQPSIFQSSVARSLVRLEELVIQDCEELKSLIAHDSLEEGMTVVDSQKNYSVLFPNLKYLIIMDCGKLEIVSSLFLTGDLPNLKYLYIHDCKELKYVFGEYRDMDRVLQQEVMLPLLTELHLVHVPSFISIFEKCNKCMPREPKVLREEDSRERCEHSQTSALSWALGCCCMVPRKDYNATLEHRSMSQELCTSSNQKIETFHTAECLMRKSLSLQNMRLMKLQGCSKLKSLFSVSIATTMILLETLEISECEELKHIITNEVHDNDHLNCTSIFPKLESLEIYDCDKLEFIFPSNLSRDLQKLKSIDVEGARELKYVFGKYDEEEHMSNENEKNGPPPIHLLALESLSLEDVPNMLSFGINKYPPLQNGEAPKELYTSSNQRIETFYTANECLIRQPLSLQNIKVMKLEGCSKLKSLFSMTIATTMIMLKTLEISECEELKHIITNEADDNDHLKCTSIFPKLKRLQIYNCHKLEFIFPSTLSRCLQKLKLIGVNGAHELKYVFGKYDDEECVSNENENEQRQIRLLALEKLWVKNVPKMINICEKKYYLSFPSLQSIKLEDLERDRRSSQELMSSLQGLQLNVTAPKNYDETEKEIVREITASRLPATTSPDFEESNVKNIAADSEVASMKETHEQGSQEGDAIEEATITIQSSFSVSSIIAQNSREIEEEADRIHASHKPMAPNSTNSEITQSINDTMEQGLEQNYPEDDDFTAILASDSNSRKQSTSSKTEKEGVRIHASHLPMDTTTSTNTENYYKETEKGGERVVPDPTSELLAPTSSSFQSVANLEEDTTNMEANIDGSFIYSQVGGSKFGPSKMIVESIQGKTTTMETKIDTMVSSMKEYVKQEFQKHDSPNEVQVTIQSTKGLMKQPRRLSVIPVGKEFAQSNIKNIPEDSTPSIAEIRTSPVHSQVEDSHSQHAKDTRDTNVEDRPKSEKAEMANFKINIPIEDNTSLPNVIPSSHHQSQTGGDSWSSPILEIGEIFQLVELKNGEPALLAKALELYPQLRLPRGQRTHPIIAFSYRVLVDILVMLARKTPYTITALDKTTLEANLGAATFLGFDKDWIESVRAKVFGIDKSDVFVAEEKIWVMEKELEKCDIALEHMQKKRMEAKEKLVIVQNEFEAVDTQMFDLLANRRNLVMKMAEFRKIISAKDRPFGI